MVITHPEKVLFPDDGITKGNLAAYYEMVADVMLPDGRSLNRELVAAGLAWWYRRYSSDQSIGALEQGARNAHRGLWSEDNPTPPWDWRKERNR